jgi:hypothetical protein
MDCKYILIDGNRELLGIDLLEIKLGQKTLAVRLKYRSQIGNEKFGNKSHEFAIYDY